MKICVLYPNVSSASAKKLARALGADAVNPFDIDRRDFSMYDLVINYGCNRSNLICNKIINKTKAIAKCIDKIKTFKIFNDNKIPTVGWTTDKKDIPKEWNYIVVRQEVDGNANKGMKYVHRTKKNTLPNAPLYTEYFDSHKEFRVVVLNKIYCIAYEKVMVGEAWHLEVKWYKYLEEIKQNCMKAAAALDIDFVGFDVLVNNKKEYVVLEANSGPVMTEEVLVAFQNIVRKMNNGA